MYQIGHTGLIEISDAAYQNIAMRNESQLLKRNNLTMQRPGRQDTNAGQYQSQQDNTRANVLVCKK